MYIANAGDDTVSILPTSSSWSFKTD
jgi:hypothetical protein